MTTPHQCQFAQYSTTQPRCEAMATRKWGEHWFCEAHGARNNTHAGHQPDHLSPREKRPQRSESGETRGDGTLYTARKKGDGSDV
jgi:hypothetical protein